MSAAKKNIYQRIAAVMGKIEYIKKDASVQGYKAVTHDAVVGRVRQHCIDEGILIIPSLLNSNVVEGQTNNGKQKLRFEGQYQIRFQNVEDKDDHLDIMVEAHADDQGDKAPGKSISYATKTAMLKVFMIETGVDDEARYGAEEKARQANKTVELEQRKQNAIDAINAASTLQGLTKVMTKCRPLMEEAGEEFTVEANTAYEARNAHLSSQEVPA